MAERNQAFPVKASPWLLCGVADGRLVIVIAYHQEGCELIFSIPILIGNETGLRRIKHYLYEAQIPETAIGHDLYCSFQKSLRSFFKRIRMQPIEKL